MKKLLFVLAAVLIALPMNSFAAKKKKVQKGEFTVEEGKLKVAMEIGYPPFEYYAEDGRTPAGFDTLLGKEISKRLGLNIEFIDTAWDGILAGLDIDRYDCIMSAMTITEERKQNYDFSQPYIGNGQALILTKNSKSGINHIDDVAGKKVGYQAETTSDFYIEKLDKGLNEELNAFFKEEFGYSKEGELNKWQQWIILCFHSGNAERRNLS